MATKSYEVRVDVEVLATSEKVALDAVNEAMSKLCNEDIIQYWELVAITE